MMNAKICITATAIIAVIIALLLLHNPFKNNPNAELPDITQMQSEQSLDEEILSDNEEAKITNKTASAIKLPEAVYSKKTESAKNISNQTEVKPQEISHEFFKKTTDKDITKERTFTPEELELLKKVPRANVVVVDKEIKLKSSGKYIFK